MALFKSHAFSTPKKEKTNIYLPKFPPYIYTILLCNNLPLPPSNVSHQFIIVPNSAAEGRRRPKSGLFCILRVNFRHKINAK
jgi:hypothetical protein